ncbi:DNA-binding response regulator [Corallococcus sp. H22C18031201]|uniref:response regulator transcription factor n=1 Tax=Citreicoccus inhibens TaxID=2849499 RepID=UPI000E76CD07|nr:response regulator transcription factor [Citreicoccus inhibens]MBU8896950.1 response regulator transcription factor [Citreicoccus inhibens]RJS20842.1 DNA-binding response regulator [Corallococcus sp. H22C18031201]
MEPHPHLLLVEDDERLAGLIQTFLQGHGFEVQWVADGPSALRALCETPPACVILDVLLPGLDGLEVCRRAREAFTGFILMLTAQDEDIQEVVALDLGADDYLTKPVRPQVLLSRLRALLRRAVRGVPEPSRATPADSPRERTSGALRINGVLRTVTRAGVPVELTDAEFDLLWMLARRAPAVLSRDDLLAELRGIEHDGLDRSIDMRISKLRRKLGDDVPPHRLIRTVRGRGYFLAPE